MFNVLPDHFHKLGDEGEGENFTFKNAYYVEACIPFRKSLKNWPHLKL